MEVRELSIPRALVVTPVQHPDDRGVFLEWYRHEPLRERLGHALDLRQANLSVSARGVVRGIHFALVPPGQAKYVTVVSGAVVDYLVDLRVGSPSFGTWEAVELDDVERRAVYLPEGVGHAFVARSERATVCYLASAVYDPDRELGVDAFDPELGLDFPEGLQLSRSPRDERAPALAALRSAGTLPSWDDCLAYEGTLD